MTRLLQSKQSLGSVCALSFLAIALLSVSSHADEAKKGPERWNSSIAKFESRDQETAPEAGALLFVGSSSIRMWDLKTSWPDTPSINNGFGGSTLADSIYHFDRLFKPYSPSAIILYAGDNDISNGLTHEEVVTDFKRLASLIKEQFPGTPVIFIAIKPSQSRAKLWPTMKEANDAIAALCKSDPNLQFADIARPMLKEASPPPENWFLNDGLHLSTMGYKRWTAVINRLLEKVPSVEK
ncbi:GDSL-type esterase/lipase family protein [Verrucomicrobiales bacterium]|jgi:lysophospholipase L1-like esterase|nr:GDSL-type esterase/lipase family protein [Verrucomicrobiales bacterium]